MVGAEVESGFEADGGEPGDDATLAAFLEALFNGGDKVLGNGTTDDGIDEFEIFALESFAVTGRRGKLVSGVRIGRSEIESNQILNTAA